MIQLTDLSLKILFIGVMLGAFIIIMLFGAYLYLLSMKNQNYLDTIQEGIDEVDIDFEVKHPRAHFQCPYSVTGESCIHMNTLTMKPSIECRDCERYDSGIRPSKF